MGMASIKDRLRENTEAAIQRGVYGVPTFEALREGGATAGELFWGLDATDMLLDYLVDPAMFDAPEMRRIAGLPVGAGQNPRRRLRDDVARNERRIEQHTDEREGARQLAMPMEVPQPHASILGRACWEGKGLLEAIVPRPAGLARDREMG